LKRLLAQEKGVTKSVSDAAQLAEEQHKQALMQNNADEEDRKAQIESLLIDVDRFGFHFSFSFSIFSLIGSLSQASGGIK